MVWQDGRGSDSDIYGSFVSADGKPGPAFIVAGGSGGQCLPDVGWNGSTYLVVFVDACDLVFEWGWIKAVWVSPTGVISNRMTISRDDGSILPVTASDGTTFLVVWADGNSPSYRLYSAAVEPTTNSVLNVRRLNQVGIGGELFPDVAWSGTHYTVVWEGGRTLLTPQAIYSSRVTPAGIAIDPVGLRVSVSSSEQSWPSVASDGTVTLVAWAEWAPAQSRYRVRGSRLIAGIPLDTNAIDLVPEGNRYQHSPTIAFDGRLFQLVWSEANPSTSWDLYTRSIDKEGRSSSAPSQLSGGPGRQFRARVLASVDRVLTLWHDDGDDSLNYVGNYVPGENDWDVLMTQISDSGQSNVFNLAAESGASDVSGPEGNSLLVWEQHHPDSGQDIYAVLIDQNGAVTTQPIQLEATLGDQRRPRVQWNGSIYMVVWENRSNGSIRALRLSSSGERLGNVFELSRVWEGAVRPDIAWDGSNFVVVWERHSADTNGIVVATASSDGSTLGEPTAISPRTSYPQVRPRISAGDGHSLVVWVDVWNGNSSGISAAFRSADASTRHLVIPEGVAENTFDSRGGCLYPCVDSFLRGEPSVAWGGTHYLVVMTSVDSTYSSYSTSLNVRGLRIDANGRLLDSAPFLIQGRASSPSVVWVGDSFFLSWESLRDDYWSLLPTGDVSAAKLDSEGKVGSRLAVPTTSDAETSPYILESSNVMSPLLLYLRSIDMGGSYGVAIERKRIE